MSTRPGHSRLPKQSAREKAVGRAATKPAAAAAADGSCEISLETLGRAGDFGSLAHYADPAYYDLTYRDRQHDVDYYVARARSSPDHRVLEFGCGNGRITLPMAQAGATVTAVDLSKPMLNDLERRVAKTPANVRDRIHWHHADMRKFSIPERYALVIAPFNTLLHLYAPEELMQFLACVRNHLAEDGHFVFDVSMPQPRDLCRDPAKPLRAPDFVHPDSGIKYAYSERFEYDPMRQLLVVWMQFTAKDGSEAFVIPLTHRQFFPQELRGLLQCAGFSHIEFTSDFSEEAPGEHTDSLVVDCAV